VAYHFEGERTVIEFSAPTVLADASLDPRGGWWSGATAQIEVVGNILFTSSDFVL